MFEATTLDAKLANAAAYFNAFEFQLYKDEGFREDNEEKRARMFADAVAEMIEIQKDFDKVDFTATPTMSGLFAQTNGKSSTSVLNAFAFAESHA